MINYDKCMSADEIYSVIGELSESSMSELKQLGFVQGMNQKELIELFDKTSEKTFDELGNLNIFGPVLTFDQILQLSSGVDANGIPNSFGALSIDTYEEGEEPVQYANVSFGAPVINIYGAGGCAVITVDFDTANLFEYRRTRDLLGEWIEKKGSPDFNNKLLSVTIFPTATNGELMVVFHELVYAQGVQMDDNIYRIIMAFDGNQTQEVMDSGINLTELNSTVEAEIARREEEMKEYAERNMAEEQENASNEMDSMYEEAFTPSYLAENDEITDEDYESDYFDDDNDEDGTQDDDWMRISK